MGARIGTGLAGLSAAVISSMLISFLNVPAYEAVGIALASDVLASATSAYTYGKNKNLDIKWTNHDDYCFSFYTCRKLYFESCFKSDDGEFLSLYDTSCRT